MHKTLAADHNENDLEGKFSLYRQPEKRTFFLPSPIIVCVCVFNLACMYLGAAVCRGAAGNMRGV